MSNLADLRLRYGQTAELLDIPEGGMAAVRVSGQCQYLRTPYAVTVPLDGLRAWLGDEEED